MFAIYTFIRQALGWFVIIMPIGLGFIAGTLTVGYTGSLWGWLVAPIAWYVSGTILYYVHRVILSVLFILMFSRKEIDNE